MGNVVNICDRLPSQNEDDGVQVSVLEQDGEGVYLNKVKHNVSLDSLLTGLIYGEESDEETYFRVYMGDDRYSTHVFNIGQFKPKGEDLEKFDGLLNCTASTRTYIVTSLLHLLYRSAYKSQRMDTEEFFDLQNLFLSLIENIALRDDFLSDRAVFQIFFSDIQNFVIRLPFLVIRGGNNRYVRLQPLVTNQLFTDT